MRVYSNTSSSISRVTKLGLWAKSRCIIRLQPAVQWRLVIRKLNIQVSIRTKYLSCIPLWTRLILTLPGLVAQPGIEVTTGPLGQGIANAVGMAIAAKQLAATYNRDELKVVDNKIWCFTGDGCLQEGVGQECERLDGGGTRMSPDRADSACLYPAAISLAGHLGLDNLILIYDNNRVTVDGSIDNCFTEDTSAKLIAQGWHVIDVHDGSNDVSRIYSRGDLRVPQMLSISAQG